MTHNDEEDHYDDEKKFILNQVRQMLRKSRTRLRYVLALHCTKIELNHILTCLQY